MDEGSTPGSVPIERRVAEIVDPDGKFRSEMEGMRALLRVPLAGRWLTKRTGISQGAIAQRLTEWDTMLAGIGRAISYFGPRGWGSCGAMPSAAYESALAAAEAGDADGADQILMEAWDEPMRLRLPIQQVGSLARTDPELGPLFWRRSRLLRKAHQHHEAGAYEASIPIVLAQIEGLAADVTAGKKLFFTGRASRQAVPVDDQSLATLSESLPKVRKAFSETMDTTSEMGSISRHGILHGRELAYDTRLNSVKCFVLLQCIVEWAQPLVRQMVDERRDARWAANAGSQDLTDRGARVDDRELPQTREALRYLHTCQMGWRRSRGAYQTQLLDLLRDDLNERIGGPHEISLHVAPDGEWWWAWRRTISGWCLGIGAGDDIGAEYHYDGGQPPSQGPFEDPRGWSDDHQRTPNWRD